MGLYPTLPVWVWIRTRRGITSRQQRCSGGSRKKLETRSDPVGGNPVGGAHRSGPPGGRPPLAIDPDRHARLLASLPRPLAQLAEITVSESQGSKRCQCIASFARLVVLGLTVWIAVAFADGVPGAVPQAGQDGPGPRVPGRHAVDQLRPADHGQAPRQGRTGPLLDQRLL